MLEVGKLYRYNAEHTLFGAISRSIFKSPMAHKTWIKNQKSGPNSYHPPSEQYEAFNLKDGDIFFTAKQLKSTKPTRYQYVNIITNNGSGWFVMTGSAEDIRELENQITELK